MEAEVSDAAVPACFSRMLVGTLLCTGGLVPEESGTAVPARFSTDSVPASSILSSKLGHTALCTGVFVTEPSACFSTSLVHAVEYSSV